MHFGRTLLAQQYEPWTSNYLDYNRLKAVLERIDDDDDQPANYKFLSESTRCLELVATSLSFTSLFDEQVETVVYFFLQRQGDIALRLCQLRSEQRQLFCEDLAEQWIDLHKRLHDTALELLHLIRFVDLNCTAIRKILKKHDRITGRRLSESYRSTHYSVLSPLFEHGGLEALSKILEDTFDELYLMHQQMQPRSNLFRSASTPTEETESVLSISSLPSKKQHQSLRYNRDEMYKDYKTIMVEIEQAKHQLKQTKGFMHMLAAPMLLGSTDEDSVSLHIKDDLDQERRISNWLNFMSTFLHLTDYYIVAPGCGEYAEKLGGTASLAGVIIGMNSVAALISTVLYSWWTSRSYKAPLICASACSVLGDLVYATALPLGSLKLIMVGRLFSGFGSARALNRRYIADTYPSRERTAASAAFVTAGALGTSAGPAIAATLYYIIPESSVNPFWQVENVPCWVMAGIWAVYLVCLYYFFKEPPRTIASEFVSSSRLKLSTSYESERRSLLGNGSGLAPVRPLYRNIPVMMTFLIYFVLKFLLESLLSSTATLTDLYFEWEGNVAGTYLAVLGLLVLPANGVVAFLAQSYDDRELMLATECFMLTGCLAILHYVGTTYTMEQYMLGSFLIFVSTNALEGPTMSLLSKTIPPYYSRGVLNVGLLATEAGTLGRAVGDIILTICGARGLEYILNNAFGSMAVLSIGTMVLTRYFYDHLEPLEEYGSHKS